MLNYHVGKSIKNAKVASAQENAATCPATGHGIRHTHLQGSRSLMKESVFDPSLSNLGMYPHQTIRRRGRKIVKEI